MALRLAEGHLSGQDALALILDYAAYADASEVRGVTAAVRCLLHADEIDAATVVMHVRSIGRADTTSVH